MFLCSVYWCLIEIPYWLKAGFGPNILGIFDHTICKRWFYASWALTHLRWDWTRKLEKHRKLELWILWVKVFQVILCLVQSSLAWVESHLTWSHLGLCEGRFNQPPNETIHSLYFTLCCKCSICVPDRFKNIWCFTAFWPHPMLNVSYTPDEQAHNRNR